MSDPAGNDWLTVHRVRFLRPRDGRGNPLPGPSGALYWRFYPEGAAAPTALWGGFAVHPSRSAAEACLAAGDAALPFAEDIAEGWHALALPVRHHGQVFWRDEITTDSALRTAARDPGGPLMVLTTGGFDPDDPARLGPRIAEFERRVEEVRRDFTGRPEVLRLAIFDGEAVDGREGFTMTLWQSDRAMLASAYGAGTHKAQMEHHLNHTRQSDRSSFTRLRILRSRGSWDGDPLSGFQ